MTKEHPDLNENDYEFITVIDPITGNNSYVYTKGDQSKVDTSCYDKSRTDFRIIPKGIII